MTVKYQVSNRGEGRGEVQALEGDQLVLSGEGAYAPGAPLILGDVIISLETASRQAAERGHTTAREVQILLVHGIVHLLGYDHEEDDEAEEMEAIERAIHARIET